MTRSERHLLRPIFIRAKLWKGYRMRVEAVRKERLAEMMSEGEAALAWDIVLTESPFKEAFAAACAAEGSALKAMEAFREVPDPDNPVAPVDPVNVADEVPADDSSEADDEETQNLQQSAQANVAWVASVCHKKAIKRPDAPNDAAFNLYTWVRADPEHMKEFMKSQIRMGSTKDGADAEKMHEDGREALAAVDRLLDREYPTEVADVQS